MGFFGAQHAILQAPLGPDLSGPELVAAVSNAGGFGFLRSPDQVRPDVVKRLIQRTRELTERPFGVCVVLSFEQEDNIRVILEEKVAALWVFWGDFPEGKVEEAHRAGVKVVHQVGSVEEAVKSAQAGVDAIVVQGVEAGGHVRSTVGLFVLLPAVVDALKGYRIPIIAAGGIVDARGYVAALALGAQGVCLGTRFLATHESCAHPLYKRKILEAKESDTEYTNLYGRARWRAPHRVIRTTSHELWKDQLPIDGTEVGQPIIGRTTIYDEDEAVRRFSGKVPNVSAEGDVESMVMYAGSGAGLIHEILPAAEVVKGIVEGAQAIIQQQMATISEPTSGKQSLHTML